MNTWVSKQRKNFFTIFLIFVLNENFANGFLEYCTPATKKPSGSSSLTKTITSFFESPSGKSLQTVHRDIQITMQMFRGMEKIIEDNLEIDVAWLNYSYPHQKLLVSSINKEVTDVHEQLEKGEQLEGSVGRIKAGNLFIILLTKSMAYFHGLNLIAMFTKSDSTVADDVSEKIKKLNFFLVYFASRIDTNLLIKTLKKLTKGIECVQKFKVPVENIFQEIFDILHDMDAAHQSENELEIGANTNPEVNVEQKELLLSKLVNMLYQYETRSKEEISTDEFKNRTRAAYQKFLDYNLEESYKDLKDGNNAPAVLKILKTIEVLMAEEFGLFGDIDEYKKKKMIAGLKKPLLIDTVFRPDAPNEVTLNFEASLNAQYEFTHL